jgi:predicted enzyme related to lactoylglutathione lyase
MKRVTGIGGVFIRARNPEKLAEWYKKHLGVNFDGETYVSFKWNKNPEGCTVFSIFAQRSKYLGPVENQFMINFRVENLEKLLKVLEKEGVSVVDRIEEFSYGKFGWIVDPEGNRVELWEPIDNGFDD